MTFQHQAGTAMECLSVSNWLLESVQQIALFTIQSYFQILKGMNELKSCYFKNLDSNNFAQRISF